MTDVHYNGVLMKNVLTKLWDEEVVYDDSDTDMVMRKFRFQFTGLVHLQPLSEEGVYNYQSIQEHAPSYIGPDEDADLPASVVGVASLYDWITRRLGEPRKILTIYMGTTDDGGSFTCYQPPPVEGSLYSLLDWDVNNGPRPMHISLDNIRGDIYRLAFEIECAKQLCHHDDAPPVVLNNRWGIDEAMDENWVITRRIYGQIRLSMSDPGLRTTDMFRPPQEPGFAIGHASKYLCVPPLEDGFRRVSMDFRLSKDGLKADYETVDRQVRNAAPWPATKMSGQYSQHNNTAGDKPASSIECAIHLEGPPGANVTHMLEQGIRLLDLRTKCCAERDKLSYLPIDMIVVEGFGAIPTIDLKLTALKYGENVGVTRGTGAFFYPDANFGMTMRLPDEMAGRGLKELKQHLSEVPWLWGINYDGSYRSPAVLLLLQCYLQVPHGDHKMVPGDRYTPDKDDIGEFKTEVTGGVGDVKPIVDPAPLSKSHATAVYTMARMESHYVFDHMRVQLPIAATVADNEDEDADTSVVVSLAPCQCRRIIRIDAERTGMWPELPEPVDTYDDDGLKGTLLMFQTTLIPPKLAADYMKSIFRLQAYYVYGMNRKPKKEEAMRVGVLPFTSLERADTEFVPDEYYQKRLDPGVD